MKDRSNDQVTHDPPGGNLTLNEGQKVRLILTAIHPAREARTRPRPVPDTRARPQLGAF